MPDTKVSPDVLDGQCLPEGVDTLCFEILTHLVSVSQHCHIPGTVEAQSVWPTAPELAKRLKVKLDKVKKRLKLLRKAGVVRVLGMSPKRYEFDAYAVRFLASDNTFYPVFLGDPPIFSLSD